MNDNRNYKYNINSTTVRGEFSVIAGFIEKGSSIIDLASGDGTFLKKVKDEKGVKGIGIEITKSGIISAGKKGIKTIQGRIDTKLPFKNKEFDYAICNTTIQMVMYPEILIKEMVRISKKQIITFPNFAFLTNRIEMVAKGRMPTAMLFGYQWYSTGEIHQLSINDFISFCSGNNIRIIKTAHIGPEHILHLPQSILKKYPNLFASMGVFVIAGKRNENEKA
jgi:methionine biosynthesis protein MetW